jgi:hypothetical protein
MMTTGEGEAGRGREAQPQSEIVRIEGGDNIDTGR